MGCARPRSHDEGGDSTTEIELGDCVEFARLDDAIQAGVDEVNALDQPGDCMQSVIQEENC